tara:strand:- start:3924 stop:4730 length:807 start_codon:yes stop_codon:yes gene_type:complete
MRFKVNKRTDYIGAKYPKAERDTARRFGKLIYNELGDFLSAMVLFGSTAKGKIKKGSDIDILVIIDDVHLSLNKEIVETYRIIIQKAVSKVDPDKLHVQTIRLTTFWEYVRSGDPVAINILRDGVALIDKGFFDPLQILLLDGRIRPSDEAVQNYINMAVTSLTRSRSNLDTAILDLYWATVDSAHAALMSVGEVPTSPANVAKMIETKLVKQKFVDKRYSDIMKHMYELAKRIMHREVANLDGKTYDRYARLSREFVDAMKKVSRRS